MEKSKKLQGNLRISMKDNRYLSTAFPFLILVVVFVLFAIVTKGRFARKSVILGILSQTVIIGTCATGISFIYSNGNLDISIGSVIALSGTLGALAFQATGSTLVFVGVVIVVALALMMFNCTLSSLLHIKTISVAIVVMQIYTAISTHLMNSEGVLSIDSAVGEQLHYGPFRFTTFFLYLAICIVVYHCTPVGRTLRLIGGNEKFSEQTGISTVKATYISYLFAGLGIGLAAVYSVININGVTLEIGQGMGMDVMLATVLGGMSIFGGSKSNSYSGFLGALTISMLNKGFLMMGISAAYIQGIRGLIFIILVYLNSEREILLPARNQF